MVLATIISRQKFSTHLSLSFHTDSPNVAFIGSHVISFFPISLSPTCWLLQRRFSFTCSKIIPCILRWVEGSIYATLIMLVLIHLQFPPPAIYHHVPICCLVCPFCFLFCFVDFSSIYCVFEMLLNFFSLSLSFSKYHAPKFPHSPCLIISHVLYPCFRLVLFY